MSDISELFKHVPLVRLHDPGGSGEVDLEEGGRVAGTGDFAENGEILEFINDEFFELGQLANEFGVELD